LKLQKEVAIFLACFGSNVRQKLTLSVDIGVLVLHSSSIFWQSNKENSKLTQKSELGLNI
jgi:hypothetical protein